MNHKDRFGQELRVGDAVVFALSGCSTLWDGQIKSLCPKTAKVAFLSFERWDKGREREALRPYDSIIRKPNEP